MEYYTLKLKEFTKINMMSSTNNNNIALKANLQKKRKKKMKGIIHLSQHPSLQPPLQLRLYVSR